MLRNHIKSAYRNFIHNKGLNAINITGLAIGMMAVLLIYQYIRFEKSYDNYQEKADRLYRLVFYRYYQTGLDKSVGNNYMVGELVRSKVPEVENFSRCRKSTEYIKVNEQIFKEERTFFADSSFFNLFTHKVIAGVKRHFLREPNVAIITKTTVLKYFGSLNVVGKTIYHVNPEVQSLKVQGVVDDVPQNSHLKFDIVISLSTLLNKNYCYTCNNTNTYFLLRKGSNPVNVEAKIIQQAREYRKTNKIDTTLQIAYHLQPVRDIHLHSNYRFEHEINGNNKYVSALLIIAIFILISAWLNYMNIYASITGRRINNVVIKKINGASAFHIATQFTVETILSGIVSLMLAITLYELLFPALSNYLNLGFSPSPKNVLQTWLPAFVVLIGISVVCGLILSIIVYKITPFMVFKKAAKGLGHRPQKIMLVGQFVIATFLITCTLLVLKQIRYMQKEAFSMNIEQTLVVKRPTGREFNQSQLSFQESIKQIPEISNITYSTVTPGENNGWVKGGIHIVGKETSNEMQIYQSNVAPNFLNFFGVKLLAGRQFFNNETNWNGGTRHVILNKEAVAALGYDKMEEILGKKLYDPDNKEEVGEIVGIVDGYFQNSLDHQVRPTIFNCDKGGYFIFIKISKADIKGTVEKVKSEFQKHFKGQYLEYFFLDEYFNNQYKLHIQFNRCFVLFSLMAIIIASLSLLGMVIMVSNARTKEIGICKVSGAKIYQVMIILNKDFLKWVIIAFVIACPMSWYAMNKWLQNFAHKTSLSWWIFALAGLATLIIAILTVTWQAYKAASINPVEALRYE